MSRSMRHATLALLLAPIACGEAEGPVAPIHELPRELTAVERQVITRSNAFGLDLLAEVHAAEDGPNVFLSPFSASMALGMTLNGAVAGTFDAMRTALRLEGVTQEEINTSYEGLLDLLLGLDPSVTLAIGNSVWARQDVPFHDAFTNAVTTHFDAEVASLDFSDPATKDRINAWVEEATNGRIDKIIDRIDPAHIMFLLNAVYFKGGWRTQFDPAETRPGPYTRADGSSVEVEMMHLEPTTFLYAATDRYEAVELPYGGGAFVMTIVLPAPDRDLAGLVASLDDVAWQGLVADLDSTEIGVVLPKFTIEYDKLLNDALADMGMGVAFTKQADFTRLTPLAEEAAVCINFVRQKTFVQVDEEGTEAAAVTAVGMIAESAPPTIRVDRPFLIAIRERLSGTILFLGAIGDPTVREPEPATQPPAAC